MQGNQRPSQSPGPANSRKRHKALIGAWLISSAIIAWTLAYLPILTGTSSASMLAAPIYSSISLVGPTSNTALKGDRLPSTHAGAAKKETNDSNNGRKIPVGCEAAFSNLVAKGNFIARCLT
jgi:hypothetical protein